MKIALPVENNSFDADISQSFGRANFYVVYDLENDNFEFIENSARKSQGGAGIKAAQVIVDSGAKATIVPKCGENAGEVLVEADIRIYKINSCNIKENIEMFKSGELSEISTFHSGYHGH